MIVRNVEDTIYIIKDVTPEQEDEFIEMNPSNGFMKVDSLPESKHGYYLYVDGEIVADATKNSERDAIQYKYDRSEQYPSVEEQLDMIFHAGLGGDEFQAAIQAVKDAYPKPE